MREANILLHPAYLKVIAIFIVLMVRSSRALIDEFESFTKNVSSTLDALLSASSYDKRLRPDFGGEC